MNFADSNLYQLFSSLSHAELKELDKAVRSPYFNYRTEEIRLYEFLLQAKKRKVDEILLNDAVKYVFSKGEGDAAKLRHVMTYLMRIINRFIAIGEMENNEEQKQLLLARSMRKRGLGKLFTLGYKEAEQYMQDDAALSPELYYHQFQLHTEYYIHSITNRRAQNEDLQRMSDDLDSFYIIQKLKHVCNLLSYRNVFKFEYNDDVMQDIMPLVQKKQMLNNPLVNLLYHNYLCLTDPNNEDYFIKLKDLLLNHSQRVDVKELRDIFTLAINYCIKRLNTGGQKYYQEVFEIYVAGLQRGVFEDRGQLSPFTYKNISAIAIGLKQYDWVAVFLDAYKEKLDEDIRDGFYAYCMARYCFATAQYERAMQLLQEVEVKEQFTDLDARVLLIKTYYELDEYGLLDYSLGNFKQQLKRKKMQTYHATVYGNFARNMSKVMHLRPYDKKARTELKATISLTNAIAEKEWLLSKLN